MKGELQLYSDKKIVWLLVISGIVFSGSSYFVFAEQIPLSILDGFVPLIHEKGCDDTCYSVAAEKEKISTFIPQEESRSETIIATKNEIFTNLNLPSKLPKKDYQFSGNKATLFAEKDSFIREGIANSNEGAAEILRVMGSGPTNNRALIAFSQGDIEAAVHGKDLLSATLKLYISSNDANWNEGQLVHVHKLQSYWAEGSGTSLLVNNLFEPEGVTWDCSFEINCTSSWNGGIFVEKPTDSVFISNQVHEGYWIKFDVTEDVNHFLTGSNNYGWIILKSDEDSSGRLNFASREAQFNEPELVLVFAK